MSPGLTADEADFVRWMDELDLEKVNLLEPVPLTDDEFGEEGDEDDVPEPPRSE